MKKLLLGLTLLASMSVLADVFDREDPIINLPVGTEIKLTQDLVIKKGRTYIYSPDGQNFAEKNCRLVIAKKHSGLVLKAHEVSDRLPTVSDVSLRYLGDALHLPPGYKTYEVNIMLSGSNNIRQISCRVSKILGTNTTMSFKEMKDTLPELQFILPNTANEKL